MNVKLIIDGKHYEADTTTAPTCMWCELFQNNQCKLKSMCALGNLTFSRPAHGPWHTLPDTMPEDYPHLIITGGTKFVVVRYINEKGFVFTETALRIRRHGEWCWCGIDESHKVIAWLEIPDYEQE